MAGKGAARRANVKRAKAKQERKKAAELAVLVQNDHNTTIAVPSITEDDLLAFQIAHFGDDTKPETFFVDAETALIYDPAWEEDDLGYYEDGAKRTLTDAQIAMFRHSELEQLQREERLQREQNGDPATSQNAGEDVHAQRQAGSPLSDASSIEDDLLGLSQPEPVVPPQATMERQPSQSSRSETPASVLNNKRRSRKQNVPYEARHKRKWEGYVEETDPVEGSLTHRRIVREMDDRTETTVDLDY